MPFVWADGERPGLAVTPRDPYECAVEMPSLRGGAEGDNEVARVGVLPDGLRDEVGYA